MQQIDWFRVFMQLVGAVAFGLSIGLVVALFIRIA